MLDLEKVRRYFLTQGYSEEGNGNESSAMLYKQERGQYNVIRILDETVVEEMDREQNRVEIEALQEWFSRKGSTKTDILTIFVADRIGQCALIGQGTQFWIINSLGRLVIRDEQSKDFHGLRAGLEKVIVPAEVTAASKRARNTVPLLSDKMTGDSNVEKGIKEFFFGCADRRRGCIMTFIILVATIVVTGIQTGRSLNSANDPLASAYALTWKGVVQDHEFYRLFTYMFFHSDIFHVGIVALSILVIGVYLERRMPRLAFLGLYLVSGIGAGAVSMVYIHFNGIMTRVQELSNELTRVYDIERIGGYGAIAGLVGAALFKAVFWSKPLEEYADGAVANLSQIALLYAAIVFGVAFFVPIEYSEASGLIGGFIIGVFYMILCFFVSVLLEGRNKYPFDNIGR